MSGDGCGTDPRTDEEWLADLFEYELCHECLRDADEHEVLPFPGTRFARCLNPPPDEEPEHGTLPHGDV